MRVLVVEDDPMIGRAVVAGLQEAGYAVDWARDGGEAELALGNGVYDLALLDLGLPRRDGLDILKSVRRAGHNVPPERIPHDRPRRADRAAPARSVLGRSDDAARQRWVLGRPWTRLGRDGPLARPWRGPVGPRQPSSNVARRPVPRSRGR